MNSRSMSGSSSQQPAAHARHAVGASLAFTSEPPFPRIHTATVIARAGDGLLERILRLVGAHEVVNPDRAYGERLARRLLYQGILEEISLAEDLVMSEVRVPPAFVGHTLAELELPKRYELTVLGLRRRDDEGRTRIARPEGDTRLLEGDIALVVAPPGASQELMERLGE